MNEATKNIESNREKAEALLKHSKFSHVTADGELVFEDPDGLTITVGSTHEIWAYGGESGDSLVVSIEGSEEVLQLNELRERLS